MKLVSIILNQREKGNPCNGTILSLPRRKSSKSLHQQTRLTSLPFGTVKEWFLLMHCWEGRQLWYLHRDADRTREAFRTSLTLQQFNVSLASEWQCKATHTSLKTPQAITEFDWSVTQSPLQPESSALRFPRVLSPEGCVVRHKVWDLMMVWFTQWEPGYMRRTHHGND